MRWFGRKAAQGAARPAFARGYAGGLMGGGAGGSEDWPASYETRVRAAYLRNPVAQRAVRLCGAARDRRADRRDAEERIADPRDRQCRAGGIGRLSQAGDVGRDAFGLGGRDGDAARDRYPRFPRDRAADGRPLCQSGGEPGDARRRRVRRRSLAGGRDRARIRRRRGHGLRQRQRHQQAQGLPDRAGDGGKRHGARLRHAAICRIGRGRRLRGEQPAGSADRSGAGAARALPAGRELRNEFGDAGAHPQFQDERRRLRATTCAG